MSPVKKPLVLMILDGWGYREATDFNAIAMARTPCWDHLWQHNPHALIETSGESVGLPGGQMGNSEVGHMNIGAGRIVYQDFTRITKAIHDGEFEHNQALSQAVDAAIQAKGTVHIMGLLSPGGVHSHDEHFQATVKLAAQQGAARIAVHAFLDGRDTPPRSAGPSIKAMQALLDGIDGADFATLSGRYFAMDRDKRWDRVRKAYDNMVDGTTEFSYATAEEALEAAYERDENDEFVQPSRLHNQPLIKAGDSIIFVNFRADRARELTLAFVDPEFDGFERPQVSLSAFACMTEYLAGLPVSVAFPSETLPQLLAEVLSQNGLRQLRIAETEKYAHVTFFFNGGVEQPFPLEDRKLIPSPQVATYDLQPEMSAPELARELSQAIRGREYDVIICNVANPDMVGHSGKLDAAIAAVEAVDRCLTEVIRAIDETGGEVLITADHGNVEQMRDEHSGQQHTAHTTNPVPLLFHGRKAEMDTSGSLRDIAPTMLHLLGLPQPEVMTGRPLIRLS